MKNLFTLCAILLFNTIELFAQHDTIYFHKGNIEPATILKVNLNTISFKYINEMAERTLGKSAIKKIVYSSGRTELPSPFQTVPQKEAWSKIMVINDPNFAEGLTQVDLIEAHTSFINLHTSSSGELKAREKLYKKAIDLNCPFIYIYEDKEILYGTIKFWGVSQHKFKAITYRY